MSPLPLVEPNRPVLSVWGLFGLRPAQRGRARAAVALALVTVAVEALALGGLLPDLQVGRIVVSASVVPALVLAAVLGRAVLGVSRREHAAILYWVCAATAVLVCAAFYRTLDHPADLPGLVLATADEELVYRLAVPALVAVVLCAAGVRRTRAWIFGFVVGGVWFVLLPGHRAQWHSVASILAFAAFAAVMAVVVERSGSVAAAAVAHLCADLLTILVWNDVVAQPERGAALGVVLVLLVLAYGTGPRRSGHRVAAVEPAGVAGTTTVVDLRAWVVPSVRRGAGPATPLVAPDSAPPTSAPRPTPEPAPGTAPAAAAAAAAAAPEGQPKFPQ